jgi:phosphoribosylanthranilate isomerase
MITQIYEIQTPYEAQALIEAGVDNIGSVITSKKSIKQLLLKDTIEIVKKSNSQSSLIPLFSDIYSISQALDYYKPDIIHFCEDLTKCINNSVYLNSLINLQENIKIKFPEVKITRSIPIYMAGVAKLNSLLFIAKKFEYISDFFLTDTIITNNSKIVTDTQPVNGFVGITGLTCDWDEARNLVDSVTIPVILAGGLSPYNVFDAILKVMPAGVDSCTQTNVCDIYGKPVRFKKDLSKVKHFVEETKRAEKYLNGG